jgi:methyl-accepting chemotaxis protein/sigma-B regulation protein RsbU (phosphoserine phosphatase)
LQLLSQSAQRIAEGHYNELIPDSRQQDEVGRLQNHFQEMQQSLATHMGEMEQLTTTLEERGKVLQATYEQAKAADKMKTNFLYNMTNEMIAPVDAICSSVETIRDDYSNLTEEMIDRESGEIMRRGGNIIALLNQLIADSEKKVEQNIEQ